ncbi:uncharacterized protein SAPINGB_P005739 [Magnusiomyces paraingens]|uniref:Uncharacterized protein n=1 Tax=Magnusiomyces paraingens TaxID=2606893 RepID=A0A5E8C3J1_9ASCO|nr:uncharacterized protein SAPINGB_P005739 [Saprochaete ingens]VVT57525.1 unnamed protein product [Saprochaete ingens]
MSELKSILKKKQKSFKKHFFKKEPTIDSESYQQRIVRFNEINLVTVTFFPSEVPPLCWEPDYKGTEDDEYLDEFITYEDLRGRAIIRYNTRHNRKNLGRGSIAESIIFHSTMKLNAGKFSLLHPIKSFRQKWSRRHLFD